MQWLVSLCAVAVRRVQDAVYPLIMKAASEGPNLQSHSRRMIC